MKRILLIALFFCLTLQVFAQTDGLTYQAVIIGPDELELPGVNSPDNYLPQTTINMRFSIIDGDNEQSPPEFQETRITETDEFGRVNLIIGKDNDAFKSISWDGGTKLLKVEIDFEGGSDFTLISVEELTYLPYAKHRDITASGNLDVDGNTSLNGQLLVEGPANFNDALNVNDNVPSYLSGTLTVDGVTNLNEAFNVNNQRPTDLSGSLRVGGNSNMEGTLDVLGLTTLNDLNVNGQASFGDLTADDLTVNLSTSLTGRVRIQSETEPVRITSGLSGSDLNINSYPVIIEGGNQGLAIIVDDERRNRNNFISFWDTTTVSGGTTPSGVTLPFTTPTMWGRIEGEIPSEFGNNADYLFDQTSLDYDIFDADIDLIWASVDIAVTAARLIAAGSDFRACFGLGACTVVPGPVDIAFAAAEVLIVVVKEGFAIAAKIRAEDNKDLYDDNKITYEGVTYASGAGDYAEYLERADLKETMTYGDVVGVIGGKISKNTINAERVMVVSFKPIVLGNMPQLNKEQNFEKVAFMGQVPVKVFGKVNIGDYILPSGKNDGIAKGIAPSKITTEQIKDIIGISWGESNNNFGFNMINVAVGLNKNDNNFIVQRLEKQLNNQDEEIKALKSQISKIFESLAEIKASQSENTITLNQDPEYHDEKKGNIAGRDYERVASHEGEIIYFEITEKDFELALKIAENQLRAEGLDIDNFDLWKKLKTDASFKAEFLTKLRQKFDKQFHYHRELSVGKRD
ncbi:hypothetical protein [uncultured Winogradskyella sp.]|uniref:hypothetical protein n=1 Tax=uncultured Winogradskyella sp. TaxID=395353 RepID=UPI0026187ACC|nr:hypothetical protein [uncultured Winogradskyella sp.]